MSMLSVQCDELRKMADVLDERAKDYTTGHNVISPMLRQAADTICELRSKLAGVIDQSEEIRALMAENAKLRDRDWCPMQLSGLARCEGPDPVLKAENERLKRRVRELEELSFSSPYTARARRRCNE